ncbi:hypothetical protein TNCV_4762961 [Trichonephila clavipes]|nr:hypothetical protein TNCV_4762961 [Trichonephila clavipes]
MHLSVVAWEKVWDASLLLLTSNEIQRLFVEYEIDELRTVIRNFVLHFNGPLSLASEKTVRRRLQQHGLSARRPQLRLPLTQYHRQESLQWCDERCTWNTNGETTFFQINPDYFYSIKIVASVFGGIVVNAHW